MQGLLFDLPDAFTGQTVFLPYLFERMRVSILQAKAEAQDARLAGCESIEHLFHLSPEQILLCAFLGQGSAVVLDKEL